MISFSKKTSFLCRISVVFLTASLLAGTSFAPAVNAKERLRKTAAVQASQEINLTQKDVTISGTRFVSDSLNGVDTIYRSGTSSSTDGTDPVYSCAAYIKKYYKSIYGLDVYNLNNGCTPLTSGDSFLRVSSPAVGDIVSLTNHWAIVKDVASDGTITLIEQNYKWSQGGSYACRVNRKISVSSASYFRLSSVDKQMHEVVNSLQPLK